MGLLILRHLRTNSKTGQAMVEMALILPLLMLILFGIMQWGMIFNGYVTLRHGAQVTARTLSLAGTTNSPTSIAQQAIAPLDPTKLVTPVVTNSLTVGGSSAIKVNLTYHYPVVLKFVVPNSSGGILDLKAQATARKE